MSLAHIDQSNSPAIHIDQQAILRALKLNPADPNTQALLLVCDRYGLDPLLKHMVLISGNPYVTRDGYLSIAHNSGVFDGIEVVAEGETDTHYTAKVAVYRKDMSRPIAYTGRFPKAKSMAKDFGPEMAVKVAEVAALRRAFNVTGVGAADERWDVAPDDVIEASSTDSPEQEAPQLVSAAAAKSALLSAILERGWPSEDAKGDAKRIWGDRGSSPITQDALDALVSQVTDNPFRAADRAPEPKQAPLHIEAGTPSPPPIGTDEGKQLHRRLGAILKEITTPTDFHDELAYFASKGRTTHTSDLTRAEADLAVSIAESVADGSNTVDGIAAANEQWVADGSNTVDGIAAANEQWAQ